MLHYSEYLHQNVNVIICNFPIFGQTFMKFSSKWRLGILFIILGSYCSIINWEGPIFGPKFGIGKSLYTVLVQIQLGSYHLYA